MPQRDPAADAHTIARWLLDGWTSRDCDDIIDDLSAIDGNDVDITAGDLRAIRIELAKLADMLALALHRSTAVSWGWTRPGGPAVNLAPAEAGCRTRAAAERSARLACVDEPTILCRLVQDWQPAPTTESTED